MRNMATRGDRLPLEGHTSGWLSFQVVANSYGEVTAA
jgi:hypothetical protein